MRTANKILMTMLAGLLGIASAQASVVYEWQPIAGTDRFDTTGGRLEITDAAYRSGNLNYSYDRISDPDFPLEPGLAYYPDSPVLGASLQLLAQGEMNPNFDIADKPREKLPRQDPGFYGDFGLNFIDGLLGGRLALNNTESDFVMTSSQSGNLWTIQSFNSDRASVDGCFETGLCSGATGRWRLASAVPSDVPSPAVWGLFLLAVLAALGLGTARQARAMRVAV